MNKPHKHAEVIKAWADGAEIELRYPWEITQDLWRKVGASKLDWNEDYEYRIKPEPPAKVYPVSRMTEGELIHAFCLADYRTTEAGYRSIANAALRHAIDSDQVVPIAEVREVARNMNKIARAERDIAIAEAVLNKCLSGDYRPRYDDIDVPAIIATVKD